MEKALEMEEFLNTGIAYMAAGNYEAAIFQFEKIIYLDKKNKEAYKHLGNAYANLARYDESETAFKTALMVSPDDGMLYFSLGSVKLLRGDYVGAVRYYNKAEENNYRSVDLYTIRANIFADSEDYFQAIREISKAIELKPMRGDLYNKKAVLQIKAGMEDEAMGTLEEFMELLPDSFDAYDMSVQVYCMREEFDKAFEIAETACARFPKDPAIQLLKLKIYIDSKKYLEAKEYADKILTLQLTRDVLKKTVIYKAVACAMLQQIPDLIETLENFSNEHKDEEVLYLLANTYAANRNYSKLKIVAIELGSLAQTPAIWVTARFYQVKALEMTEGIEIAAPEYKRLTSEFRKFSIEHPKVYETYIYRLIAHMMIGEYKKALELSDYLEQAYPQLPDGHLYRYHIYSRMGEMVKASEEKEQALKINPSLIF